MRTYTELRQLDTFLERFDYLILNANVGDPTFDDMRWLNQAFYHSREWRQLKSEVRARDYGLDLGAEDMPIQGSPVIHHMNPITVEDIIHGTDNLLDPEFLITTSHRTHNAIHYGNRRSLPQPFVERVAGDTLLWGRR